MSKVEELGDDNHPECEHVSHYSHGSLQCRDDAEFAVVRLYTMAAKLCCAKHLPATVLAQIDENSVLVRPLEEGGVGWPISSG